MISLERTKELMGKPKMTDKEAVLVRNTSYSLAELLLETLLSEQCKCELCNTRELNSKINNADLSAHDSR